MKAKLIETATPNPELVSIPPYIPIHECSTYKEPSSKSLPNEELRKSCSLSGLVHKSPLSVSVSERHFEVFHA